MANSGLVRHFYAVPSYTDLLSPGIMAGVLLVPRPSGLHQGEVLQKVKLTPGCRQLRRESFTSVVSYLHLTKPLVRNVQ